MMLYAKEKQTEPCIDSPKLMHVYIMRL